jgi:poly(beta-D-mannuronate) lyase
MMRARVRVPILCLALALGGAWPVVAQESLADRPAVARTSSGACDLPTPIKALQSLNWYSDSKSSVVDPALRVQRAEMQMPMTIFMDTVVSAADQAYLGRVDRDALACADRNLANWAKAGGLTQKPANTPGIADQTVALFGLNVMALKRRESGVPVSAEVQHWLHDATANLIAIYTAGGPRNNLYVWSGAVAATANLVQRDRKFDQYASKVWRASTVKINSHGVIPAEMSRGQRALVYHQYFNAALGVLHLARTSAGHIRTISDKAAMVRLNKSIGNWACNPSLLQKLAGAKQEDMSRWNRAMGYAFNADYLTPNWRKCVSNVPEFSDPTYGGRFDLTADVISAGSLTQ